MNSVSPYCTPTCRFCFHNNCKHLLRGMNCPYHYWRCLALSNIMLWFARIIYLINFVSNVFAHNDIVILRCVAEYSA